MGYSFLRGARSDAGRPGPFPAPPRPRLPCGPLSRPRSPSLPPVGRVPSFPAARPQPFPYPARADTGSCRISSAEPPRPLCPSAWLRFWLKFDLKLFSLATLSKSVINWSFKFHVCPVFFPRPHHKSEQTRTHQKTQGGVRPGLESHPSARTSCRSPGRRTASGPGAGRAFGHLSLCRACQQPVLSSRSLSE